MIKVIDLDGNVKKYYGAQCGRFCVESDGYGMPFKVIEFGDYGQDSLLIPVVNEREADEIKVAYELDCTNVPYYVNRCETYYYGDFQEIVDKWYLVGETDITPEKIFEIAKENMPYNFKKKYSRAVMKKDSNKHFTITFYPQTSEYTMRQQLKEMGFVLKRHKNTDGINMYMIIKASNNAICAGENFTMSEADVDNFIHG